MSKSVVASDAAAKDEPGQVIQLQRLAWDFANARNREGGVLNLYRAHKGRSAPVSEKALNLTRDDSFHREIYRPEGLVLAQSATAHQIVVVPGAVATRNPHRSAESVPQIIQDQQAGNDIAPEALRGP